MSSVIVRNTFVELIDEDVEDIKGRARANSDVAQTNISDKDTDAGSQSSSHDDSRMRNNSGISWADDSEDCETEEDSKAAMELDVQRQLEQMARENVRLLRENAMLRHVPATPAAPVAPTSQWVQMSFQVPFFMMPGAELATQAATKAEGPASRRRRQRAKGKAARAAEGKSNEICTETDEQPSQTETRTTVMLRNLPRDYSRDMICDLLNNQGFNGKYDFVYMPIDFVRKASLGYAFVNLVSTEVVTEFWKAFDGFKDWNITSPKVCRVSWSNPHQGLEDHVNRYKNSPLMHENVPDECRPILLESGIRIDFPPATKSLRAPRLRASRQRCPFWNADAAGVEDTEEVEGSDSENETLGAAFKTFDVFA